MHSESCQHPEKDRSRSCWSSERTGLVRTCFCSNALLLCRIRHGLASSLFFPREELFFSLTRKLTRSVWPHVSKRARWLASWRWHGRLCVTAVYDILDVRLSEA